VSSAPSGAGGSVALNSTSDAVTVNGRIEVSSNDPPSDQSPTRRSAFGGSITAKSGASGTRQTRAVAINIGNSSQLFSLLAAAPSPGPGGKVTIRATGANSDVKVRGQVRADRGTIDIRHTGENGNVTLDGGSQSTLDLRGDIVKAAALGTNGILKVGGGSISADTTLQLYASGFNGEVQFIADVSLTGNSVKSIAGHAVTILNGIDVNIGGPAANVYVNSNNQGVPNANYSRLSGGNGNTTGQFTGSGANAPKPLSQAPPIGSAPGD